MDDEVWLVVGSLERRLELLQPRLSGRKQGLLACACFRDVHPSGRSDEQILSLLGESSERELIDGGFGVKPWRPGEATVLAGASLVVWALGLVTLRVLDRLFQEFFGPPGAAPSVGPPLRTPTVLALAEAAYNSCQLPSGHLEQDRLAVLADALEDAGCDNAEILGHLRSDGPHRRGCWCVDLLLGKE